MKWDSKITKLEKKHIRSYGVRGKADLENLFENQRKLRAKSLVTNEPCFVCKSLALKMGYKIR